jgi:hypothetical protein
VRAKGAPRRATAEAPRPFILRGSLTLAPQDDGSRFVTGLDPGMRSFLDNFETAHTTAAIEAAIFFPSEALPNRFIASILA